jgi:hypothetical protein
MKNESTFLISFPDFPKNITLFELVKVSAACSSGKSSEEN